MDKYTGPEHVATETPALNREGRLTFTLPKTTRLVPTKKVSEHEVVPAWLEHAFKVCLPFVRVQSLLTSNLQKNQAYALTESRIPCLKPSHSLDHIAPTFGRFSDKHGCHISPNLEMGCDNLTLRFTREDLHRAEVINQIDRKFIACRISKRSCLDMLIDDSGREPYPDSPILVLVDQHAADERIRVERFLKDLCLGFLHSQDQKDNDSTSKYGFTRDVAPSRPVLLTQHEALTISQSPDVQGLFRKWGVRFTELSKVISGSDDASDSGSSIGYLQLYVSAIPEVVADKVRLRHPVVFSVCFC